MDYRTDFFQRAVVMNGAKLAAGTYKRGQLLGCADATGIFGPFNASGSGGIEKVAAVCVNDAVLAEAGNGAIAVGEFEREGIIAANEAVTPPINVDAALIAQCFKAGIILN